MQVLYQSSRPDISTISGSALLHMHDTMDTNKVELHASIINLVIDRRILVAHIHRLERNDLGSTFSWLIEEIIPFLFSELCSYIWSYRTYASSNLPGAGGVRVPIKRQACWNEGGHGKHRTLLRYVHLRVTVHNRIMPLSDD